MLRFVFKRASATIRRHPWIPASTTLACGCVSILFVSAHTPLAVAGSSVAALITFAFTWGYSRRALKQVLWPPLTHLRRSSYAQVWDAIATSAERAAMAVSGESREDELRRSGMETVRNLAELARIGAGDEVLEIGCGVGRIGLEIAPRCQHWTGADISSNMLRFAADRLRRLANVRLVHLQRVALAEFPDASFDVVYATNMFPHIDEHDRWCYFKEAFRVLRPAGRIFVDNVDLECDAGWTLFANDAMRFDDLERPPYMPRYSTAAEMMSYAARAGFQCVIAHHRSPLVIITAVKPGSLRPQLSAKE